ncbi:MAG: glycosyltransferase family 39 protein [Dehalococcoidia bacterium]
MSARSVSEPAAESASLTIPGFGWRGGVRLSRTLLVEASILVAVLIAIVATYSYRLGSVIVPSQDEGTYLYAAKLIAQGELPYRDFFIGHPPLLMYTMAIPFKIFGTDVMAARYVYMGLVMLSTLPLYLIVRYLSGNRWTALLAVPLYTAGMLFIANTGRTVRLEPFTNVFLIPALALYVWRPESLRVRFVVGALLGAAVMVKFGAVLPAAFMVVGDLAFRWRKQSLAEFARSWAIAGAGGALVVAAIAAVALMGSDFFDAAIRSQLDRPSMPLDERIEQFTSASGRYPLVPLALVGSLWLLVWSKDARMRVIALVTAGQVPFLVFAFNSFNNFYMIQLLPGAVIVWCVLAQQITERFASRLWAPVAIAGTLFAAIIAPLVYEETYHHSREFHTTSASAVVRELETRDGYIYALHPSFALQSGRDLYPWYYTTDTYLARITGKAGAEEFLRVFAGSDSIVVFPGEFNYLPSVTAYMDEQFELAYEDQYWQVWSRRSTAAE